MIEDKYIGLALAVSSSLAIGTSFIITKKVAAPSISSMGLLFSAGDTCRALMMQEKETLTEHKHPTIIRT